MVVLVVIAVLIAGGAVAAMIMLSRGGLAPAPGPGSGSTSPSQDSTESAEPTNGTESASPSDGATALAVLSLTPADQSPSGCPDTVGTVDVVFQWSTTGAENIYFGIQTDNAKASPYASGLGAVDSITVPYPCGFGSEVYTLTLEGADGTLLHRSVTLLN